MTKNIKTFNNANVVPFTSKESAETVVPEFAISLVEAKERIEMLENFVDNMMVEGVDYGLVPDYSKPTLLKPGAEKLCDAFGFSKHVDVVNRVEIWEKEIFAYEVKVTLISKQTGLIEAEGIGACNSREKKYVDHDVFSLINTFLKMAKKRALIDAVLSATRASGVFTQDIENLRLKAANNTSQGTVTRKQLQMIYDLVDEAAMPFDVAKQMMINLYHVDHSTKLSKKQASAFIDDLLVLKS